MKMTTVNRLPTDIVRIILHFIANSASASSDPDRIVIPLLAVCREWRAIVAPLFYSHAYFRGYKFHVSNLQGSHTYFKAHSNIGLVLLNGYGDCVKSFAYSSLNDEYTVDSLLSIVRLLDISVDACPNMNSLMDYHGDNLDKRMDWDNVSPITAAAAIATTLASTFSNIKQLDIDIANEHDIMTCFSSALTDCFADTLVRFNYKGPQRFSCKIPMTKLNTVSLHLTKDFNYVPEVHPTICPQAIKKLTLFSELPEFDCALFKTIHDSSKITFEKLEYLHCENLIFAEDDDDITIDYGLQFPNIKKTVAKNCVLPTEVIKNQLESGLQELRYFNKLPEQLALSRLDLSSLAKLMLVFDCASYTIDDFVAHVNTLASRTKGIPSVYFAINVMNNTLPDTLYWPNLTRLEIFTNVKPHDIMKAALKMPDLVHLQAQAHSFNPYYTSQQMIDGTLEYLEDLRTSQTKPSASRIELFSLNYGELNSSEKFIEAVQVLKWYWPKLQTIDI